MGQTIFAVNDKKNDVGHIHRDLRLLTHLRQNHVGARRLNAAGINQREMHAVPFCLCVDPVTGYAGGIFYDGNSFADDFIEERRFADIGAAYDRYNRFTH